MTVLWPFYKTKNSKKIVKFDFIIDEIIDQYMLDTRPWIIGFSGGKDSTALLQLTWYALRGIPPEKRTKDIHVVCNDTLVENPKIVEWIDKSLESIDRQAKKENLPIKVVKTTPLLEDSFWVNLIGKGYPSPNNSFRWCTERLKIKPTSRYIRQQIEQEGEVIILLGTREDESSNRKKSMDKYQIDNQRLKRHVDLDLAYVFTPLRFVTTNELWQYLFQVPSPWNGSNRDLVTLYKNGTGGDCPLVIDTSTPSCGQSRFGCWVCTVVKKDKSMEALIDNGEEWMLPMLELRDWLVDNRDNPKYRSDKRRNGTSGKGPFTIEARAKVLLMLLEAQLLTGQELITGQELKAIQVTWNLDGYAESVFQIYNDVYGITSQNFDDMNDWEKIKQQQAEELEEICKKHQVDFKKVATLLNQQVSKALLSKKIGIQDAIKKVLETQ
jgi:DNA sulfur modification protein DndC